MAALPKTHIIDAIFPNPVTPSSNQYRLLEGTASAFFSFLPRMFSMVGTEGGNDLTVWGEADSFTL